MDVFENKADILNLLFFLLQLFLHPISLRHVLQVITRSPVSLFRTKLHLRFPLCPLDESPVGFDFHFVLKYIKCVGRVIAGIQQIHGWFLYVTFCIAPKASAWTN
jgi:hypothetical protein